MSPIQLMLVDGSAYLYRAHYALPSLTSPQGYPTGAIYGVIQMLRRLKQLYQPERIVVVFDQSGETFRHRLYPDYKIHRKTMPEELVKQCDPLLDVLRSMGIPCLRVKGVEADDLIATFAKKASELGWYTVISSSDKDLLQLVNEAVHIHRPSDDTFIDREKVIKTWGLPPEKWVDYLSLIGDVSDNIPGIPSVGPKTAVKWLLAYGDCETIKQNAHHIAGKVGTQLRTYLSRLSINRELIQLQTELDLPDSLEALSCSEPDFCSLRQYFQQFGFQNKLNELGSEPSDACTVEPLLATDEYLTLDSKQACLAWFEQCQMQSTIALYLHRRQDLKAIKLEAEVIGFSMAIGPGQAAYADFSDNLITLDFLSAGLNRWQMTAKNPCLVLYDAQHSKPMVTPLQASVAVFDTLIAAYVLNQGGRQHQLSALAFKQLNKTLDKSVHPAAYADVIWQLHTENCKSFDCSPDLYRVFKDIDMPLVDVLMAMRETGVLIDQHKLEQHSKTLAKKLMQLESDIQAWVGYPINLASPKQLQTVLYETLGLPVLEKTPKGQPSTSESVLQILALNHPCVSWILEHRHLSKLKSTYTDVLPKKVNAKTGRLHTFYHQTATSTGRLTSTDPNLQNIPIRTHEGRAVRQAFVAAPGYCLLSADYSQIELRIMAHFTGDLGLCSAFRCGVDIHKVTASEVLGIPVDCVDLNQRRQAKSINFGLIYGMSSFGLAKQLGIDQKQAQDYMRRYFERYPGVETYMEMTRKHVRDYGYVETLFGRRLYLPDIQARKVSKQKAAERAAINAPLQGTASDLIKLAMIRFHKAWFSQPDKVRMIMQVHDELVFEVKKESVTEIQASVHAIMTGVADLQVPLEVQIGLGENWDQAHA